MLPWCEVHQATEEMRLPSAHGSVMDGHTQCGCCKASPHLLSVTVVPHHCNVLLSAPGRKFVEDSLESLCERGAKIVRLDAFGYATKKLGTRCFFEVGAASAASRLSTLWRSASLWVSATAFVAAQLLTLHGASEGCPAAGNLQDHRQGDPRLMCPFCVTHCRSQRCGKCWTA